MRKSERRERFITCTAYAGYLPAYLPTCGLYGISHGRGRASKSGGIASHMSIIKGELSDIA